MNELPTVRFCPQATAGAPRFRLAVSIINHYTRQMTLDCVRSVEDDLSGRQDAMVPVIGNDPCQGSAPADGGLFAPRLEYDDGQAQVGLMGDQPGLGRVYPWVSTQEAG